MIYIHEIEVADKDVWGGIVAESFILPAKIRKIRGVMVNVIPSAKACPRREFVDLSYYKDADGNIVDSSTEGAIEVADYKVGGFITVQIGAVSLSLNDDTVIISGLPANITSELKDSSYTKNSRRLGQDIEVGDGSMMRMVMEEKMVSPFVTNKELAEGSTALKQAYGNPSKVENGYILKIYIDYE